VVTGEGNRIGFTSQKHAPSNERDQKVAELGDKFEVTVEVKQRVDVLKAARRVTRYARLKLRAGKVNTFVGCLCPADNAQIGMLPYVTAFVISVWS
jgi:hypothetical protein